MKMVEISHREPEESQSEAEPSRIRKNSDGKSEVEQSAIFGGTRGARKAKRILGGGALSWRTRRRSGGVIRYLYFQ